MMKMLFITIIGFLFLSTVVSAELSVEDLEKIRQIVNEAELRLEKSITESQGYLEKRITEQSKRLDFHATLIITLIGALIAFVGVPLVLIAYQQNRRTQQDDIIKGQATEIQALREKIESLEKSLS